MHTRFVNIAFGQSLFKHTSAVLRKKKHSDEQWREKILPLIIVMLVFLVFESESTTQN